MLLCFLFQLFKRMSLDFIILSAGNGTRMNSSVQKPFHEIAGKSMICHVIDLCKSIVKNSNITVVIKNEYKELFSDYKVNIAVQNIQNGTATAVSLALDYLKFENSIILCADMPLVTKKDVEDLLLSHDENDISFVAIKLPLEKRKMPYGRVITDNEGNFLKIVEYNDATDEEKSSIFANSGIYIVKNSLLNELLPKIKNENSKKEFYFTDILNLAVQNNRKIKVVISENYDSFHGVNTMIDLSNAEEIFQNRRRSFFLERGVKLYDPKSVYFSTDTNLENDVVVEQNVVFKGKVTVKSGSVIKSFSYIEDCVVKNNVKIGPFARIRGNSVFENYSEIGNFVEVKGSIIGVKSKSKHLAYIGDSSLGESVNIGAGTITCNYDGFKKHKTDIKDNVKVGANCSLVAPVVIESNTVIGAGSVITKNVPRDNLAIARSKQQNIDRTKK